MAATRGPDVRKIATIGVAGGGRGLRLRVYEEAASTWGTILFVHGGGFVIGSLGTHDALCRSLAVATGARVVAVEYRLAPEHPFPAAREDCLAALGWVDATNEPGHPVAICGDSAGGYLAVELALTAARPVSALGLLYPVVASMCATASWEALGTGHLLTRAWMRWAWSAYLGAGAADASLLGAGLASLPPTHILTAACDPLRDEGEALAAAIVRAGGCATASRYDGMIHGFASLPALTPRAGDAVAEIVAHLHQHMR